MQALTDLARSTEHETDRARFRAELVALRKELDSLVASALDEPAADDDAIALRKLTPEMRCHLAHLMRVPLQPDFYPLLELKAKEYLEQQAAFEQIAREFGFEEGAYLAPQEARGSLVLSHNGSLLQLSAPGAGGVPNARRFVYQNIYGSVQVPTEGTLVLGAPVQPGERVLSSAMLTSPVAKLQLAREAGSWAHERGVSDRVSRELVLQAPGRTLWGADPTWVPAVRRHSIDRHRADLTSRSARVELAALVSRYADPALPAVDDVFEAQIVGLCMHLQHLRLQQGERGLRLVDVLAFATDRGERARVAHAADASTVLLDRPGRGTVEIRDASAGDQVLVRGAPLVLLDGRRTIVAILGDVSRIDARAAR